MKTRGPSPRVSGPRAAPVHGGPQTPSQRRLTRERAERCPHAWNLTAVEEKGGGDGGDPHRLQEGVVEVGHGRATVGNNRWRRHSVGWMLRTRERANEGGVSVVMAGGCSSPFYSGRARARRGEGGGNSRR
jgi:hypothetical protein